MSATITRFGYDATLPAIRPDSFVEKFVGGGWCLRTPSCWDEEMNPPIKVEDGEEPTELLRDLSHVGKVELDTTVTFTRWIITGEIVDPDWWENQAAQGWLNGLDLSKWGIEVRA